MKTQIEATYDGDQEEPEPSPYPCYCCGYDDHSHAECDQEPYNPYGNGGWPVAPCWVEVSLGFIIDMNAQGT